MHADRDPPALEISDRGHTLIAEQLEASHMSPGEHHDGAPGIDPGDEVHRAEQLHVGRIRRQEVRIQRTGRMRDIVHVGKPFQAQQLLGEVLRRQADGGIVREADRRRFRRGLCVGQLRVQAENTRRACHGQPTQEASPRPAFGLWGTHGNLLSLTETVRTGTLA
jgi:hypothetical protein